MHTFGMSYSAQLMVANRQILSKANLEMIAWDIRLCAIQHKLKLIVDWAMSTLVYYCDESSFHDTHMAVGGLAVDHETLPDVLIQIQAINERCNVASEVKWENAKPRRQNAHQAYIDLLFDLIENNKVHFHLRFAPFDDYDHRLSGSNKRQDTVGKMHYQLILHRPVRYYGAENRLVIHPDNGTCTAKLRIHSA